MRNLLTEFSVIYDRMLSRHWHNFPAIRIFTVMVAGVLFRIFWIHTESLDQNTDEEVETSNSLHLHKQCFKRDHQTFTAYKSKLSNEMSNPWRAIGLWSFGGFWMRSTRSMFWSSFWIWYRHSLWQKFYFHSFFFKMLHFY